MLPGRGTSVLDIDDLTPLHKAAGGDRLTFGAQLMEWAATEPGALKAMPFVLARTLGREWGSANLAALWGMMMTAPKALRKNAARAGFETGIDQGDRIFQAIVDTPQGLWVGQADTENNLANLRTPSGVSYMLENRETMLQMFPELFESGR